MFLRNIYTCFVNSFLLLLILLIYFLNLPLSLFPSYALLTHHRWSMIVFLASLERQKILKEKKGGDGPGWHQANAKITGSSKKSACNNNTKQEPWKKNVRSYIYSNIIYRTLRVRGGKNLFWHGLMDFPHFLCSK